MSSRAGTPTHPAAGVIRFGPFEANLRTQELRKEGNRLRLPNQSFVVLAMLLENPGELVTREELRGRLWPNGRFVEYDQGLNAAVNRLREALGDAAGEPKFIETLPRRGYRFIGVVEPNQTGVAAAASGESGGSGGVAFGAANGDASGATNGAKSDATSAGTSGAPSGATSGDSQAVTPNGAHAAAGPSGGGVLRWWRLLVVGVACAAVVVGVFLMKGHRSVTPQSSFPQPIPFTTLPGQEVAPTFSPDGSQIAFAWNGDPANDHHFDLYVKSIGSERMLRLTSQPSKWIVPAWSPDGSYVAFARESPDGGGIFLIPALGGSERRLTEAGLFPGAYMQMSWSPDGKVLAYSAYRQAEPQRLYLLTLDSLKSEPVPTPKECPDATEPAFSPDGRQLAFICRSSAGVYTIDVMTLPQGPARLITSMLGSAGGMVWSPDGTRLILANDSGDGGQLLQVSLRGELTRLAFGEDGSQPAVSSRGARLAYVRGRRTIDVWRANITAADPKASAAKFIYSTREQGMAQYSRDGKRIAFQSNRSGSSEIWMVNADGTEPVKLTSFNGPFTGGVAWCSDGRRIAFDSRASGMSAIYVEDIFERLPRKVQTTRGNLSLPVWSEDCRWLFANDTSALYRFPSSGGEALLFTERPTFYTVVSGDRIIFNVRGPHRFALWSKPISGGPEAPLEGMPALAYTDAWVASKTGVYYTHWAAGSPRVEFYEFASRATRTVMTLPKAVTPMAGLGLAVSPDQQWILFMQTDDEQSDIMIAPSP